MPSLFLTLDLTSPFKCCMFHFTVNLLKIFAYTLYFHFLHLRFIPQLIIIRCHLTNPLDLLLSCQKILFPNLNFLSPNTLAKQSTNKIQQKIYSESACAMKQVDLKCFLPTAPQGINCSRIRP